MCNGFLTCLSPHYPLVSYSVHLRHYHLQVQANSKKKCTKKPMLFLASMGETGLSHDIFFEFSLGPFEVVEAEGGRLVKEADFEAENFFYYFQLCFPCYGIFPNRNALKLTFVFFQFHVYGYYIVHCRG